MSLFTVSYPGVQAVISGSYTLSRGFAPGSISLTIAPQGNNVPSVGTVTFARDGVALLTLPQCAVDAATVQRNTGGQIVQLTLMDRRWKWRFAGLVSGHYNQRDADSKLIEVTSKTRRQLVEICLQAMGETCGGLDLLPTDNPEVDWLANNPASEFADLLGNAGLELVMKTNGSITIVRPGVGALLPVNDLLVDAQQTVNPPEVPSVIRAVGGRTEIEGRLPLEAVGRDTDGTWKTIDELSYRPAAGWGRIDAFFLAITDPVKRKLAQETVFRCYRIKSEGIPVPPSFDPITNRRQILPLIDRRLSTYTDENGERRPNPSRTVGIYWIHNVGEPTNSSFGANYLCFAKHQLDTDDGIVTFDREIKKWDAVNKRFGPAEMFLDCVYPVASRSTWAYHHSYYDYPIAGGSGGIDVIKPDNTLAYLWEQRRANPESQTFNWVLKKSEVEMLEALAKYAQGRAAGYPIELATQGRYAGIVQIEPDGAIEQVTWEIGPPTFTTASRNGEHSSYIPPKRQRNILRDIVAAQRRGQLRQPVKGVRGNRGRDD